MDDTAIRLALRWQLTIEHAGEDALIIEELGLNEGEARADLAVVNGSLNGFEIKSEVDTLNRLPRQRDIYGQFFDTVTLVVAERHLAAARKQIPRWWGIVVANSTANGVVLRRTRAPRQNRRVNASSLVRLLWRSEALAVLEAAGKAKGLRGKARDSLWEAIATTHSLEELKRLVRDRLKVRGNWRSAAQQRSSGDSLRLVSKSLHSPVRQRHLHSHQCIRLPN